MESRAENGELVLHPIGVVHNEVKGERNHRWRDVVSEIRVREHLANALDGIEGFSHVEVIFWLDRSLQEPELRVHPQGRGDLPLVGYLATRSPHRTNPLGVSLVRLLERKGNVLVVRGLDAFDGTPVLDLKPFMPRPLGEVKVPWWVAELDRDRLDGE